ncbi:MAG: dTDP-4-dehydrorhamnose reductase [Bacteroidales bacterium]|nr:dTDP-4-dehydrorhamnose reductase [Bacteroidales bacterium]
MRNILITGAKGQLGNEIKVIGKNFKNLSFIYTDIEELNITNINELDTFFRTNLVEFIVNCAAYTAVDKAESEPDKAELINATAVKNLRQIAEKCNCYLIHISTDYVFDGQGYMPYKEIDRTNPQSVYGKSKLKGEQALEGYEKGIIIRTSWLYSSFGNNFVKTILRLAKEKDELKVVFDQVGTPTYAADLVKAIITIVQQTFENSEKFVPGIYHFSNEGICSWYDFAKEIIDIIKLECKIIPIESKDFPTAAKRPFYSVLNKEKIKSTFNFEIPFWKDSLRECLKLL